MEPAQQLKRCMVVQEAAEETSDFVAKHELAGKEHTAGKFAGHLQAEAPKFCHYLWAESGSQLSMEAQVLCQAAIFKQIIGDLLLQLSYFFWTLEEC